jgi:hypothetical protein
VLTAAAALATLGGIGAATADSSSPATVCRATGTNNDLSYSNQGRISNPNSSDRYLICPLHRSTAYNERWVYVTARDRHYSRDISCTAFSTNDDGGSGWWGSESTSGSSTTYSTLTIDSRPYSYTFGTSYVRCTLPARYSGNNSSIARVATDKSL